MRTHIVVVRNGLQGSLYINGAVSVAATSPLLQPITYQNVDLSFGKDYRDGGRFYNGQIDRFAIYPSLLTDAQVTALYNSKK